MTALDDQAAVAALLERFSNFFDAVLVGVVLDLPRDSQKRRATLRLLAQELDGTWYTVTLSLARPREFKLVEGRTSYLVLSDGLDIQVLGEAVAVDLAPEEGGATLEELRRSDMYVLGAACTVDVEEFRESSA